MAVTNATIAEIFDEIADLLDIQSANARPLKALRKLLAARVAR